MSKLSTTPVPLKPRASRRLALAGVLLLSLTLSFALAGCGGGGSNGGGQSPSAPAAPAPLLSVSAVTPDGLTLTLAESAASVPVGGSVTYTVTFTNTTAQSVTFQTGIGNENVTSSTSPFTADVTVTGAAGVVLMPESGTTISGFGPATTLAPGQSVAATLTTSGYGSVFAEAGAYAATAVVSLQINTPTASGGTSYADGNITVGPLALTVQ